MNDVKVLVESLENTIFEELTKKLDRTELRTNNNIIKKKVINILKKIILIKCL